MNLKHGDIIVSDIRPGLSVITLAGNNVVEHRVVPKQDVVIHGSSILSLPLPDGLRVIGNVFNILLEAYGECK